MSEKQSTGLEFQALQAGWEERIDQLNLRTGERLEKYFGLHRESIVRALPQLTVRNKYRPEWSPTYTFLIAEDQRKINDLLKNAEGGKSLVIAASGLSFLASLANNVQEIDVVDSDPNQIAWNYALAALIGLTEKQDLKEALLAFRKTNYNFFDFHQCSFPKLGESIYPVYPKCW